jgi:hypothetical protein
VRTLVVEAVCCGQVGRQRRSLFQETPVTSSQFLRTLLLLSLAACAVDSDDDLDDEIDLVDDSDVDTVEDVEGWTALELEGLPSGSAVTKQLAAPGFPCPRDFACLFGGSSGNGVVVGVRTGFGLPDLRQLSFNDKASSWRNRTGRRYCWYNDINFNGASHRMPARKQANITGAPNNEASSYKPC